MTENEDNYILSGTEIKVLLSGLGYEHVMGFFSDEEDNNPQYAKIINVILNLVNQDIVRFDEGKMYIDGNLTKLLCHIGDSAYSFSVTFPMSSKTISCYCSDCCAVICEPMIYQKDRYIIRCCSKTEFLEEISEYDDLARLARIDYDISEKNVWKDNLNTVAFIDIFRKFEHYAEISVCSHAFGVPEMIIRYINGSEDAVIYSKENFLFLLNSVTLSE